VKSSRPGATHAHVSAAGSRRRSAPTTHEPWQDLCELYLKSEAGKPRLRRLIRPPTSGGYLLARRAGPAWCSPCPRGRSRALNCLWLCPRWVAALISCPEPLSFSRARTDTPITIRRPSRCAAYVWSSCDGGAARSAAYPPKRRSRERLQSYLAAVAALFRFGARADAAAFIDVSLRRTGLACRRPAYAAAARGQAPNRGAQI